MNDIIQIGKFIGVIASFITSLTIILSLAGKIYSKQITKIVDPINKHLNEIDMSQCKNFLVRFLSDIEQGVLIDEVEKERAFEVYEHYIKLGGNSYIHNKWNKLIEK